MMYPDIMGMHSQMQDPIMGDIPGFPMGGMQQYPQMGMPMNLPPQMPPMPQMEMAPPMPMGMPTGMPPMGGMAPQLSPHSQQMGMNNFNNGLGVPMLPPQAMMGGGSKSYSGEYKFSKNNKVVEGVTKKSPDFFF